MSYGHDFSLTQRSRLSGPYRFLEDIHKTHRKFYRDIWEKVSPQKLRFVRIFEPHFWLHFSKFQLFWILLTQRHIIVPYGQIFSLTHRSKFGTLSRYREHVCKVHRKCGRSFLKKFHHKKRFGESFRLSKSPNLPPARFCAGT